VVDFFLSTSMGTPCDRDCLGWKGVNPLITIDGCFPFANVSMCVWRSHIDFPMVIVLSLKLLIESIDESASEVAFILETRLGLKDQEILLDIVQRGVCLDRGVQAW